MKSKGSLLTFIYYVHTLLFVALLSGLSSFAIAVSQSQASTYRSHMAVPESNHHHVRRATGPHPLKDSNVGPRQSGNSLASLEVMRVLRIKNIILWLETGDKNISTWYVAVHHNG